MRKLFISGTDTGVGKTLASGLLCKFLLEQGYKVTYYKPVQTGAEEVDGRLISVDTEYVKSVCSEELQIIEPLMFRLPASPHLAAAEEDLSIDLDAIVSKVKAVNDVDFLIIEGAGGLAVPFNDEVDMAELCKRFGAELVLVCRAGLGTLNHTFLSVEYASKFGLNPMIIVSGCSSDPDVIEDDNLKMMAAKVDGRLIGKIPFTEGLDTEEFSGTNIPAVEFQV